MAIFRVPKHENFTVISNVHLSDTRLSLKAKGLLSYMLAKPDSWNFTLAGLAAQSSDGVASIRTAVSELTALGYVRRSQCRNGDGSFGEIEYDVIEDPAYFEDSTEPEAQPLCENCTAEEARPLCDFPLAGEPIADNPISPNRTLVNTDRSKYLDTPPSPSKSGPDFDRFWSGYPRKVDKDKARRAWKRLKVTDALLETILAGLERDKRSPQWVKDSGQFIPYPATWLNNRRWEAEAASQAESAGQANPPEQYASSCRVYEAEEVGFIDGI